MEIQINKPFHLEGPSNLRELGGYPARDGKYTKTHVFLRSDALNTLTNEGGQYLYDYGLRLIVDLRGELVRLTQPDRVPSAIEDVHVPLYDHLHAALLRADLHLKDGHTELSMPEIYNMIVDGDPEEVAKAVRDLIAAQDCALFHCTAGKDRTGIIAMLLLELAGVPREIIIADYAQSGQNVSAELRREEELEDKLAGAFVPIGAFESKPAFMEELLHHLDTKYGSPEAYLTKIGITDDEKAQLLAKFLTAEKNAD